MENLNIGQAGVTKLLKGCKMNKASGPDKISPNMLNELSEDIGPHLTAIFTTSMETGRIPPPVEDRSRNAHLQEGRLKQCSQL